MDKNKNPNYKLVWDRFVHRTDAFVYQWYNPEKKEGGYWPAKDKATGDYYEFDIHRLAAHINGRATYGLYQLDKDSTVKWLCFDVDIEKDSGATKEDVQLHTIALARAARNIVGQRFLVEQSGSKGYHIWIFFSSPISALEASGLGRFIEQQAPPSNGIHVEVFPKQIEVRNFGNLVKIPLGIHKKTGERCLFVNGRFEPLEDQWAALANVGLVTPEETRELIKHHHIDLEALTIKTNSEGQGGLPCMTRIMNEGLTKGSRDKGLFKLGCFLRHHGLPSEAAHDVLMRVNQQGEQPLDDATVRRKLESAYADGYSPFPCTESVLDHYCSSSCRFWQTKVKNRWTAYGKDADSAIGRISRD